MTSIYVGNLPFTATEDQVRELFAAYGQVTSVKLPNDRETGRPRGFGFVEMSASDAQRAIEGVNGKNLGGRYGSMKRRSGHPAEAVAAEIAAITAAVGTKAMWAAVARPKL